MAENPFAPAFMNPNASKTGLWDLRMMSAANRAEAPFMRGARGMYGHQGMGDPMIGGLAGMANEPDYSQFTFNPEAHAQATQALSPYGVRPLEANQVQQNSILPNSGFFGNHPRLSRGLEGFMYGTLASHGGENVGESIQGALEGVVGGHRIQQGLYRQQFARPFEAAGMMEQLGDMQQKRQLQQAQIKRYSDESDIQRERAETERIKAGIGLDKINATRPFVDPVTGQTYTYQEGGPPSIGPDMLVRGGKAGWQPLEGTGPGKIQKTGGAGTDFDRMVEMRNSELAKAGKPPMNSQQIMGLRGQWSASAVAPGEAARQPYKNLAEAQQEHKHFISGLQTKLLQSDNPQHVSQARESLMLERMTSGNFNLPSDSDIKGYIKQNNQSIQNQIDGAEAEFSSQYPQTQQMPPEGKTSSQKRGKQSSTPTVVDYSHL